MKSYAELYINGQWVASKGGETIEVINPSTEEVIGSVPAGTVEDLNDAVIAARNAFKSWANTPAEERASYIKKLAATLAENREEIGKTIAMEVGMPVQLSTMIQAGMPTAVMGSYAKIATDFEYEESSGNSLVIREPIGVCGFITPWNYPLHQIVGKVAPALAAGCTMVVKPSKEAPLNAFLLADAVDSIGLPAGVFNLVSGVGSVVGEALSSHPEVDMISFTGSTGAGIRVAELAAQSVKRVTQELGGKSANILLDDADFSTAVPAGINGCFINSGQTCSAVTRMLVPASKQAEVIAIAKSFVANIKLGGALEEGSQLGPLVSASQKRKVTACIEKGIAEGATLVVGGPETPEGLNRGYFVKPTIFADVKPDMTIAKEEIFGPVLCIIPYETEEQAIQIANDSIYGLSGAVSSANIERAKKVARQLRTGQVAINGGRFNIMAPFGGYKQSGNGREFGKWGLEEFLETKSLNLP